MYSGESVYDGVYIRLLCNVFCKKIVVCRRFLASPKLCALLGRRYSILLFRNIREYSRIYSSILFIYLKYLLNVNLLIFSFFRFFSIERIRFSKSFLDLPASIVPSSSSTCKKGRYVSQICFEDGRISIVKFLKAATVVRSAKHRFYTGELGIYTHDRVHRLAREN